MNKADYNTKIEDLPELYKVIIGSVLNKDIKEDMTLSDLGPKEVKTCMELAERFRFLELLRRSGVTNMFGAAPYLQSVFGLNSENSKKTLSAWMETYNIKLYEDLESGSLSRD